MGASATVLAPQDLLVMSDRLPLGNRKITLFTRGELPWPSAESLDELRSKLVNYGICDEEAIRCVQHTEDGNHILLEFETDQSVPVVKYCVRYALSGGEPEVEDGLEGPEASKHGDSKKPPYVNKPQPLRNLQAA